MELTSLCPFSFSTLVWEPRPGDHSLTVCVKITFCLAHGREAALADDQVPAHEDLFWDSSPRGGLYSPSDFVPFKPRADVLLVGRAYAPGGAPVEGLFVRVSVGEASKSLRVVGDRAWTQTREGMRPGPPRPFTSMPLVYERAAARGENHGGVPLSPGAAASPLPNIDSVDEYNPYSTPGFGPLPPSSRAQRHRLTSSAVAWASRLRAVPGAPPEGFDFNYFNAAPRDQQTDLLRPTAPIVLENLHPSLPRFETRLPALRPKLFRVDPASGRPSEIALRADTLWIDSEQSLAVISWRGLTPIAGRDHHHVGRLLLAAEGPGERVRYEDLEARARSGEGASTAKFQRPHAPAKVALDVRHDAVKAGAARASAWDDTTHALFEGAPRAGNPLPFVAGPAAPPPREPPSERKPVRRGTMDMSPNAFAELHKSALPFVTTPVAPSPREITDAPTIVEEESIENIESVEAWEEEDDEASTHRIVVDTNALRALPLGGAGQKLPSTDK